MKNVFLNGDLEKEVYMNIPPEFELADSPQKVYKVKKAFHGLKQYPRAWLDRFTKTVKRKRYEQCQSDHTLFVKHCTSGKKAILIVYVNDIILTRDHIEEIQKTKELLTREF